MSITEDVARFIMSRGAWTTSMDVPLSICSKEQAQGAFTEIITRSRYETKQKKITAHHAGKKMHVWAVKVLLIKNGQQGVKRPVVGFGNGIELRFDSAHEADKVGGFSVTCIRRCVKGQQGTHAGYQWRYEDA